MWNHREQDRAAWLKGPAEKCSMPPADVARARRVVLLGAPGTGKGTQAELLAQRLGACHLSTGDVFRAASCNGAHDPAMQAALNAMRSGELVSDDTILQIIRDRGQCLSCRGGFILDGFPRTVRQAQALEAMLRSRRIELDAVINYVLPSHHIIARLSGRRTCGKCKAVFHVEHNQPKQADRCDYCDGVLILREDDRPTVVKARLDVYAAQTAPLIEYFGSRGLLVSIDASGSPQQVISRTMAPFSAGLRPHRQGCSISE